MKIKTYLDQGNQGLHQNHDHLLDLVGQVNPRKIILCKYHINQKHLLVGQDNLLGQMDLF